MSRLTTCPGLECQAKVKIIDLVPGPEINYCCIPCWEFTWSSASTEDPTLPTEDPTLPGHSTGCWDRQATRADKPVIKGKFKIHTPDWKNLPPSRLGGSGAGTL